MKQMPDPEDFYRQVLLNIQEPNNSSVIQTLPEKRSTEYFPTRFMRLLSPWHPKQTRIIEKRKIHTSLTCEHKHKNAKQNISK